MRKYKVGELVEDLELYPRECVDTQHIGYMRIAHEAGVTFPPIVICRESKVIADGVHRRRMYQSVHGEDYEVDCIEKRYGTRQEIFRDAVRYNAGHGRTLTTQDRTHCLIVGERLGIEVQELAADLNITVERAEGLRTERVGTLRVARTSVPIALKQTIRHMAGRTLTKRQDEAQQKLGGMQQAFYANQLITLIESDLLDLDNENLMERLRLLHQLLDQVLVVA